MDFGSLLVILALIILVGMFISRPFFQRGAKKPLIEGASAARQAEHTRSALLAERDRVISALQDLEFDHTLGKIPSEDYPTQRAALLQAGADALRQLDELDAASDSATAEDRLEAAVIARRADAAVQSGQRRAPVAHPEDEIEALVAARRKSRQEKAAGFCPKCGKPAVIGDKFCSRCGETLN
jgi:hypothetical protein